MSLSNEEYSDAICSLVAYSRLGRMLSSALAFRGFKVRLGLLSFFMDTHKDTQGTPDLEAVDRTNCVRSNLGKCVLGGVCFSAGFFSYAWGMMAADEGTQDTLRLQFKAMQEMQHKRLQKQMERQMEKELSLKIKVDDQKEPLKISDGLSLLQAGEQNSKNSFEQR